MIRSPTPRSLFMAAAVLAFLALMVDIGERQEGDLHGRGRGRGRIDAVTLAGWLRDRRPDLFIADIRSAEAWEQYHVPRAKSLTMNELRSWADSVKQGPASVTLVIYGAGDGRAKAARQGLAGAGFAESYYLADGITDWLDDVMSPRLDTAASPEELAAFEKAAELSRYFGGTPRLGEGRPGFDNDTATVMRPSREGCGF